MLLPAQHCWPAPPQAEQVPPPPSTWPPHTKPELQPLPPQHCSPSPPQAEQVPPPPSTRPLHVKPELQPVPPLQQA
jgi:hypothetical protein